MPSALKDLLDDFAFVDRNDRIDMLIELADEFHEVDPAIASRPFPEENHVTRCESQAYVFPVERPDGTLDFEFAVDNPQGLSAKSFATIVEKTLNGAPLEEVAAVPTDIIFDIYGKELSMGKGQGLMGMLDHVTSAARRVLHDRQAAR
jgi:cysteine desulfuration protein SufE